MTKVRLKEVTKELNQTAGVIISETERLKRNADMLIQALRQQESQFLRQEDEERQRLRFEQQQQLIQQQTKAWTMPDDEVAAKPEAAAPVESAFVKTEEKKEEHKASAEREEKPVKQPEPAPSAQGPAAAVTAPKEAAPANKEQEPVQTVQTAQPVQPVQAVRPAAAQASDRPARTVPAAQPAGRPAPGAQQYGRPAPGAQQYGRPAPGAGQGGFGRPAPGAQGGFGRPAPGGVRPGMRPGMAKPSSEDAPLPLGKERVSNYDPNKKNYTRQHDPERVTRNKRQQVRNSFVSQDDESVRGGKRRSKKPSVQQLMAPIKIEKAYMTAGTITVKDLTERIGRPAGEILKKLLLLGNLATINSELDYDTASLVTAEFGIELEMKLAQTAEDVLSESAAIEDEEKDLQPRPPVITIMGHVDHGKTSLLDYIRSAHVTRSEAGGITQHIGAYSVNVRGEVITFLDTPGHEAFTAMRARGAQATDIAVLVVAADDGVMPQTVEAINHAKAAGVPIIVAINKMDKDTANPGRIMQDLTNFNLVAEEWGGDVIMVPVSALTGDGVDKLLDMIILQAEVMQLQANPDRKAQGVIIEAKLDKSRGPLATVLLQNGTLHIGDSIIAGMASGRVRAMQNDKGERVTEAGPSMPVEISGFTDVPSAGDEMVAVDDDRLTRQVAEERRDKEREQRVLASSKVTLDNLFENIAEGKVETLNLIVKADVQGSVEAVRQALEKLSSDKVKIRVLHAGVGAITKDDVNLATAFSAIIIGFNIRPDNNARDIAEKEEVDIRLYRVIYQAIEDIEKAMKGMLEPVFKENILGHAEIRSVFRITGAGTIAGCYVTDGKLQRNASVRLLRDHVVVFEGKLSSLKRFKDDAKEVAAGYECGAGLDGYNDIKERDVIECFVMEEVEEARA